MFEPCRLKHSRVLLFFSAAIRCRAPSSPMAFPFSSSSSRVVLALMPSPIMMHASLPSRVLVRSRKTRLALFTKISPIVIAPSFSSPFQARLKLFKLRLPSKPARKPFTPSAFIWFQLKSRCVNVVFSFSRSPNAAAVLFPSELLERLRTFRVRLKFCRALVIASPEASAIPHLSNRSSTRNCWGVCCGSSNSDMRRPPFIPNGLRLKSNICTLLL
mmetsp:Transcript_558/g.1430  ORF Transcript_558/g.1430 Transcript_558/m.1430 type:complete len:216 (-) Transcript_558:2141-2788(-)